MYKRILITGASGFIGGELASLYAGPGVEVYSGYLRNRPAVGVPLQFDIRDEASVRQSLLLARPDLVVHCAYDNTAGNRRSVIVDGTEILCRACNDIVPGVRFIFLSSEWVFDGSCGPYSEEDKPEPQTEYGQAKLAAEQIVSGTMANYAIVRTGLVSREEPLAPRWQVEEDKLRAGQVVQYYDNEIRNPIHVADLCQAIRLLADSDESGIWHVAGPDYMSRYEELEMFVRWRGLPPDLIKPGHSDGKNRPLDCSIRIDKFTNRFGLKIRGPKEYL
ncbi:MAG: SDR family oxidoreductase [Sedimentisphaerales bacterium]|nr:SDR family oxidoreductase [Sedimentisphaerales bacterium]MBN2842302.1 SDR family oxidoreductase [Sedimentisphaerales bacterium]